MEDRGRVALVTGAGRKRLGWHIATALAQRGYAVVIHYHTAAAAAQATVAELRQGNREAMAWQANLSEEASVRGMIAGVSERFGRLDVLVNTAAIWEPKALEQVTAEDVRRHFEVNTLGTFLCAQHAGLQMVRQPSGGCIINFGDWAIIRPYRDYSAYFPSKGAIPALTRSLAVELGTRNPRVRVNAILPGPVLLPETMSPQERQQIAQATLVKREGTPEHVVQAVLFLLDNDFVTGVCLPVDGGRSVYAPE
jgi:pteridine reductase